MGWNSYLSLEPELSPFCPLCEVGRQPCIVPPSYGPPPVSMGLAQGENRPGETPGPQPRGLEPVLGSQVNLAAADIQGV